MNQRKRKRGNGMYACSKCGGATRIKRNLPKRKDETGIRRKRICINPVCNTVVVTREVSDAAFKLAVRQAAIPEAKRLVALYHELEPNHR